MSLLDRVVFTPNSLGTADFKIGSAVNGFQTPLAAGAIDGQVYSYAAQVVDPISNGITAWEVGKGTYVQSTNTLRRTTILFSSNSNTKVNFGTCPQIMITALADDFSNKLGSNADFYVSTTGSDSTGTGSALAPWRTLKFALNTIAAENDFNGNDVVLHLANGTYDGASITAWPSGSGNFTIQGNPIDHTLVTITDNYAGAFSCIDVFGFGEIINLQFDSLTISPSAGNDGLTVNAAFASVYVTRCLFLANASGSRNAFAAYNNNIIYTIGFDANVIDGGGIKDNYISGPWATFSFQVPFVLGAINGTINLLSIPSFSSEFVYVGEQSNLTFFALVVGSATGKQFLIKRLGFMQITSSVPGTIAGVTEVDGQLNDSVVWKITRADIPNYIIGTSSTITTIGFSSQGDLGTGAIYTSVGAGPTGPMAIQDAGGTWFQLVIRGHASVGWFGAEGNGTTDDSTAVLDTVQAVVTAGGGTINFPPGTFKMLSQFTFPAVNDTPQVPLKLQGEGAAWDSDLIDLNAVGSSTLDLRYNGTVAKLLATYHGLLEITGLAFTDNGTSSLPYVYSTHTTLYIHENSFKGNPSKTGLTADQDAIVLGGTTTTNTGNPATDPFSGYGTAIDHNFFQIIRRGIYLRKNANGVAITNNVWDINCGADATAGAIEFLDIDSIGNYMARNLIECINYIYPIQLNSSRRNTFVGNFFYDNSTSGPRQLIALYHGDTTSPPFDAGFNTIFGGWMELTIVSSFPTTNGVWKDENTSNQFMVIGTDAFGRFQGFQQFETYDTSTTIGSTNSLIQLTNMNQSDGTYTAIQHNGPGGLGAQVCFQNEDVTNTFASVNLLSRGSFGVTNAKFYNGDFTVDGSSIAKSGMIVDGNVGTQSTAANNTTTGALLEVKSNGSGVWIRNKGSSNGLGGSGFCSQIFTDSSIGNFEIYNQSGSFGLVLGTNNLARIFINSSGLIGLTGVLTPTQVLTMPSNGSLAWDNSGTADVGISRQGPAAIYIGNGNAADGSGQVTCAGYNVGTNSVVGARNTGWTAMSGASDKASTFDPSTVTLDQLGQRVSAIQAALTTHGLIGT